MAALTVLPAMNGERTLHPFFAKTNAQRSDHESLSTDATSNAGEESDAIVPEESKKRRMNGRAAKSRNADQAKTQKTIEEIVNPDANVPAVLGSIPAESAFESSPRRKRRRTSLVECVDLAGEDEALETGGDGQREDAVSQGSSPKAVVPVSSPLPTVIPVEAEEECAPVRKTPPKKMLRLNASGKFSSPVSKISPKEEEEEHSTGPPRRRGRPRKSKEPQQVKHLIVALAYSLNDEKLGQRIDRILSGEERHESTKELPTPKKQRTPRKAQPAKAPHPFFSLKPKEIVPKPESPRKASAITPGKLRTQTIQARSPVRHSSRQTQDYVVGSGLLKDRLMFRHPGAKEPAWPSKEQAHVRGLEQSHRDDQAESPLTGAMVYGNRKRKTARVPFPPDESLLRQFGQRLRPEQAGKLREDGFREPHPSLTLPRKLLISGQEIAWRVSRELSVRPADCTKEELTSSTSSLQALNPALQALYDRIPTTLSAFDEGRGETMAWTQKYEPTITTEVLQPRREMTVLRNWLTSLTVTSVEGLTRSETKAKPKAEVKAKKKPRRKAREMDDFLVSDDEAVHDMDELTDPEDVQPQAKTAKSVVQLASAGVKLSNAVLLSGPHGCGKTAAAHAVAKELGFKVFELSSHERRSGKDVLDKVGDMTENHLVKHHGTDTGETSAAEEPSRIDEAFQRDLVSGRQGKMNTFFKPKVNSKEPLPTTQPVQKKQVIEAVRKLTKDQQQSLILLEEVDILFKEDKDFWNTIFKLIASSKRPFILTCNDEDLVPLQAMSLHAILRFSPPAADLAADYLLLLAANEGHLLKRDDVKSLYRSKGQDLRASIAELDFWCQMGVGDARGGLSWFFQRYPPGCDLDSEGRRVRVVSEGTYHPGMALSLDHILDEETQLLSAKREYGVDAVSILGWNKADDDNAYKHTASLREFYSITEALSAADVYAGVSDYPWQDLSQPPMPDKARAQYIEGMTLLQTDQHADYSDLTSQLAVTATLEALRKHHPRKPNTIKSNLQATVLSTHQPSPPNRPLTRHDFACFDAISAPPENTLSTAPGLYQSAFDGPLTPIATDLAPYVRSILQHENGLAEQRDRLSSIMNEGGGRSAKRARTTRAARSALEGGLRSSTRRERWFTKDLNADAVLATGGRDWPRMMFGTMALTDGGTSREGEEMGTPASSAEGIGMVTE